MTLLVTENQWKIFQLLLQAQAPLSMQEIAERTALDIPFTSGTLLFAQEQGWITLNENQREEISPSEEAADLLQSGLPERQALEFIVPTGRLKIREAVERFNTRGIALNEVIKWGGARGWLSKERDEVVLAEAGRAAVNETVDDERAVGIALERRKAGGVLFIDELPAIGLDAETVKNLLKNRPALAKLRPRTLRLAELTAAGRQALSGEVRVRSEKNQLSSEDITSGAWQEIELRAYDVTLAAERIYPAKIHPLQKIIQQVRQAFLQMGFEEVVSPQVESAFWDFDALFQPQDHPARDMQDTFYLARPERAGLPDPALVSRVQQTHENGGDTGSCGWGYRWSAERARQVVLRTHTTATSIRALVQNPKPPRKVFCVGKVFRNESISYKHLPEFHQVDGIIIDEQASLATLLGTLKAFYAKMGFPKVKFKPSFFPYTEPSIEVYVYMESRGKWLEMGGSGVFRPEVTVPGGCNVPVLAWGLGLERLAMMRFGFADIRELYWSDLDNTKEVALCR